jgi:hypothetical protein
MTETLFKKASHLMIDFVHTKTTLGLHLLGNRLEKFAHRGSKHNQAIKFGQLINIL